MVAAHAAAEFINLVAPHFFPSNRVLNGVNDAPLGATVPSGRFNSADNNPGSARLDWNWWIEQSEEVSVAGRKPDPGNVLRVEICPRSGRLVELV